ncbi:MAG: tetratricopeptide repeat protein [Streptosporangiaceae bacterium]
MLGPDHPSTIMARVWLGRAMVAAGHPGDALSVLTEAVAGSEHICGPDHADTLTAREDTPPRRGRRVTRATPSALTGCWPAASACRGRGTPTP